MSHKNMLEEKLENDTARVGIIGMGYVGLPLALAFCGAGFHVTGFDIDEVKCEKIRAGKTYIKHIPAERYAKFVEQGRFTATDQFKQLKDMDVILICVPTPLDDHQVPDLSFVAQTAATIAKNSKPGQLIILESSTYPGTTDEILVKALAEKSLQDGRDCFVAFSPEREDPSNPDFTTRTIPKVVGADQVSSRALACRLYEKIIDSVVPVSSAATAEATKLTENIFRAANIALVNELKLIYDEMGVDVWEVIEAASTKPFGYMPFYPGPGLGGHCIPIDPFYLSWKARQYGLPSRFIELAGEVNTAMPEHVVNKLSYGLSETQEQSIKGARILIVGVAYKNNVDDDRESPAYRIIELLEKRHAIVDYHDPYVPEIGKIRKYPQFAGRRSLSLNGENLKKYNAVMIITAHENVDYQMIAKHSRLVVDTRNAMAAFPDANIIKA